MKGGSYQRMSGQLHRLDRESDEWLPCDENGEYLRDENTSVLEIESDELVEGE